MVSLFFASWFLAGCVPLRAEDCTVLLEDGLSGISKNLLNSHASFRSALKIGHCVLSIQDVLVLQGKLEITQGLTKGGRCEPLERIVRIAVAQEAPSNYM